MGHIFEESHKTIHILQRNDRAQYWTQKNPILMKGEMGIEIDTGRFKFGDGLQTWCELEYAADETGSFQVVDDKLTAHIQNSVVHTTQEEKALWSAKADANHSHDERYEPIGAAANKMDKIPSAVEGNIAVFDDVGNVRDYGSSPDAFAEIELLKAQIEEVKLDLEGKANIGIPKKFKIPVCAGVINFEQSEYYKTDDGFVLIQFHIRKNNAVPFQDQDLVAILPVGYRPSYPASTIIVSDLHPITSTEKRQVALAYITTSGELRVSTINKTSFNDFFTAKGQLCFFAG